MNSIPTDTEYEILEVLWRLGPATVKQVHEEIQKNRDLVYTSTLKTMQIMFEKGMLERNKDGRKHIYTSVVQPSETRSNLVKRLLKLAFGGSAGKLVLHALSHDEIEGDDLDEIKAMLEQKDDRP